MTIAEKVDDIIARRKGTGSYMGHGMVDKVREKLNFYMELQSSLIEYQSKRAQILCELQNKSGVFYALTGSNPDFEDNITDASAEKALKEVENAIKELKALESRFDRDTINISVVGQAGQGKSRLLQSISGVDNSIIPSDKGGHCTGAKSVICNKDCETYAMVRCYSESELLVIVQKYLDALDYPQHLGSVQQIKSIDLNLIYNKKNNSEKESYLTKLEGYVNNYSEYSEYIGQTIEVKKDNIREFVAQYLENKTPVYKYLAVKEVEIFTPFIYKDAGKIKLVDTIGLGDTTIGLHDKMISTLINDSDAAILIRRPNSLREGITPEDNRLYDGISEKMEGRDIGSWLFYVLNTFGGNEEGSDILKEEINRKINRKALQVAMLKQIDCADKKAVESQLVVPLLHTLSENLLEIDNKLMSLANKVFNNAYSEVYSLKDKLANLLNNGMLQSIEGGALFDDLYEKLSLGSELKEFNQQFVGRNKRDERLENAVKEVLKTLKDMLPSIEEIVGKLKEGDKGDRTDTVYNSLADDLQSNIRNKFDNVCNGVISELQDGIKESLITKFYEAGCMKNIPLMTSYASMFEWLKLLVEEKTVEGNQVNVAFEEILSYRLHIEGLLQFKVHCALDYLQPKEKESSPDGKLPRLNNDVQELSVDERAQKMRETLAGILPTIANTLVDSIHELLIIPNNSFNSLVQKVRDRLFYNKEGMRDLKNFYRSNCNAIWSEEFSTISKKNKASADLGNLTSCLNKFSNNSDYIFKN